MTRNQCSRSALTAIDACVDFASGENHAGDRALAQASRARVQGRGLSKLLAKVGRRVDQEPVFAIMADGD